MMREAMTRYGRHNFGVLWIVLEPMIFTMGVAGVWSASGMAHGKHMPIVAFALTGYSSVLMWRNTVSHCASAIQHNHNLLFHRNVRVVDVLLTRIMLEVGGATASFLILSLAFLLGEWIEPPHDLMLVLEGWMMLTWFAIGLGLTIGAATAFSPAITRIWQPTAYLLFPFSGAAFLTAWLPSNVREIILLLPMVHGVECIRAGYFAGTRTYIYDLGYMAFCNLTLTLTGLWLTLEAGKRVEAE
jgi:capsular polysaccharide transport system permease protein